MLTPGQTDDALDQLASRAKSLETAQYTDAKAIAAVQGEATLDLTGDVTIAPSKTFFLYRVIGTDWERFGLYWSGTDAVITTQAGGAGTPRNLYFTSGREFILQAAATKAMFFDAGDVFLFRDIDNALATRMWLDTLTPGWLHIDNILENTGDAGVTIEAVLIKDGFIYPSNQAVRYLYDTGTQTAVSASLLIGANLRVTGTLKMLTPGEPIGRSVDNSYLQVAGGSAGGDTGAIFTLYGKDHATLPGYFEIATPRAHLAAALTRLQITGAADRGCG